MTITRDGLSRLVVKNGVMLGGLTHHERLGALAVVWRALPLHEPCEHGGPITFTEAQVNDALRQVLSSPAAFIDVDHVELRRWLVDTGFLSRDGFGRAYVAVAQSDLSAEQRAATAALPDGDVASWIADLRAAQDTLRAQRKRAWQRGQQPVQADEASAS